MRNDSHSVILGRENFETPKALSSDLHWCYFKIFPTQYHTVAVITHDKSDAVVSWKGESLEEYWDCILDDLI